MSQVQSLASHGVLIEPATLQLERLLPGPIERVWAYLTDSNLRRQWLAAGDMELAADAPFEFVWRNDELGDVAGQRPPGMPDEHRMRSRIIQVEPPSRLVIGWGEHGEVSFELRAAGDEVALTLTHRRVGDRSSLLNVSAGWHAHLGVLAARLGGEPAQPFWETWSRLRAEYDQRLPA